MNILTENVYNRQLGIIDPDKLTLPIAIIGAGSIGGWTALALAKMGCSNLTVIDFDNVEEHNTGSQIYGMGDIDKPKVTALAEKLSLLTPYNITGRYIAWDETINLKSFPIVIAAVDSITTRARIYNHLKDSNTFYIDGRMASNAIEIYTTAMNNPESVKKYTDTLFDEAEAREVPCSERSVVYNVYVVGGFIANIVARHVNELPIPNELFIDLYNFTLFT